MSADNGIYILVTLTRDGSGKEYRVQHLQAVENYTWDHLWGMETKNPDIHIQNAREMWKDVSIIHSEHDALAEANRLLQAYGGWTEYGIQFVKIDRTF